MKLWWCNELQQTTQGLELAHTCTGGDTETALATMEEPQHLSWQWQAHCSMLNEIDTMLGEGFQTYLTHTVHLVV